MKLPLTAGKGFHLGSRIARLKGVFENSLLNFFPALVEGYVFLKQKFVSSNQWLCFRWCLKKCQKRLTFELQTWQKSILIDFQYCFSCYRLTVIDSDGAANSTIASLTVNKPVDYPPIANAGPNQAVTLPQNFITLNGNQSSDDHEIVSYEWSLSPKSKGKVVAMQVCLFLLALLSLLLT